jgi:uncharacterized protein YegP (UPF0339 family)
MFGGFLSLLFPTAPSPAQVPAPRLRFEIFRDERAAFRWRLKGVNGRIIADSAEGYKTKAASAIGTQLTPTFRATRMVPRMVL